MEGIDARELNEGDLVSWIDGIGPVVVHKVYSMTLGNQNRMRVQLKDLSSCFLTWATSNDDCIVPLRRYQLKCDIYWTCDEKT